MTKKSIDVLEAIQLALQPSDENFEILLSYFFIWFKPVWLKQAIEEWADPVAILNNYTSGMYYGITKRILELWWEPWLNDFLSDAEKLYKFLTKDPEIKKLLDTEKGRKYLNYMTRKIYDWAYNIVSS